MELASLVFAEAVTNLKDFTISSSKESLHVHLRRCGEEPTIDSKGSDILFRSNCGNQERRLYFEEAFAAKEGSNQVIDKSPALKIGADPGEAQGFVLGHSSCTSLFGTYPFYIGAGACVHLNYVPLLDKGGNC